MIEHAGGLARSLGKIRPTGWTAWFVPTFFLITACLTSACGTPPQITPLLGSGPVLIFDIDTLRADHLGCYGYDRDTSPRIDAFASEAHRFEWAFSQAPMTSHSQGSIFTGLYPSNHGLIRDEDHLAASLTTLAESFSAAGYRTAAFVDGGYMLPKYGFDQGFDSYEVHHRKGLETIGPRAIQWLSEHAEEQFLLLLHTYDVHAPFEPPEPYRSMFLDDIPRTLNTVSSRAVFHSPEDSEQTPLGPHDLAHSQALYDGGIRFTDDWVGRILEVVRQLGLDRRATIVFLSDHGEAFQEHGIRGHERLYVPVTRIPLLIRPPGGIAANVIPDIVQSIDLMPTLLEGVGIEPPQGLQGRSLLPLLRGDPFRSRPAFSEFFWLEQHAVVSAEHQLVVISEHESTELYEFRQDPLTLRDLAKQQPVLVDELTTISERWQEALRKRGKPEIAPRPLDEKASEDLRDLGYIQ